jgi:hypothetical protein
MSPFPAKTISGLCEDIAAMHGGGPARDAIEFVEEQLRKMPWFLRVPILALTVLFGLARPSSPERRKLQLESWRTSRIGPCRDLIRFYTSLSVLALYSGRATRA